MWQARDTRLGRIVAIKQRNTQETARFEQEARVIAALNHPSICTLHDIGPDYLVMKYVEGMQVCGPIAVEQAVRLATQIAGALAGMIPIGMAYYHLLCSDIDWYERAIEERQPLAAQWASCVLFQAVRPTRAGPSWRE